MEGVLFQKPRCRNNQPLHLVWRERPFIVPNGLVVVVGLYRICCDETAVPYFQTPSNSGKIVSGSVEDAPFYTRVLSHGCIETYLRICEGYFSEIATNNETRESDRELW
jgi:hypothetical protein